MNQYIRYLLLYMNTGELGYDRLNGTRKLVRHMQNLSYTYDEYLICIGLGPSISSVICKNLSYGGLSYPNSPVVYVFHKTAQMMTGAVSYFNQ